MKRALLFMILILMTTHTWANCLMELQTQGLSSQEILQVKNILKNKNYQFNSRTRGDHDLIISMGEVANCIPGFEAIFKKIGYYRVESATLNIFKYDTKSISRISGNASLFQSIKSSLKQIPVCR